MHQPISALRHRETLRCQRRSNIPALLLATLVMATLALTTACSLTRPEIRRGVRPHQTGTASWYGPKFHGRQTANGETYDQNGLTAAHRSLPFGTVIEVVNLDNGRSVRVRVNDRGPFVRGRIVDLSRGAAEAIGMIGPGLAKVALYLIESDDSEPPSGEEMTAAIARGAIRFTVQAAAFRDHGRALRLRDRLALEVSDVEIRSADGWHRVQVGRFTERRDAEARRRALEEAGIWAVVVRVPADVD